MGGRKTRVGAERVFIADLTPLFNWNTKQVFVYLLADYSTPGYVRLPTSQETALDRLVSQRVSHLRSFL